MIVLEAIFCIVVFLVVFRWFKKTDDKYTSDTK